VCFQLIFADVLHQVLWVTTDEGESYTRHPCPFIPDHIVFQTANSPGADQQPQSDMVLGYDKSTSGVSQLFILPQPHFTYPHSATACPSPSHQSPLSHTLPTPLMLCVPC